MSHKAPQPLPPSDGREPPLSVAPPSRSAGYQFDKQAFSIARILRFLTEAGSWYETSAPTVADHLDFLYRRLNGDARSVSALELGRVMSLLDDCGYVPASYAANMIYKLRNELGFDTTGHAGF